jgi:hypothetical protein
MLALEHRAHMLEYRIFDHRRFRFRRRMGRAAAT